MFCACSSTTVCCGADAYVAMYAVDALRQLVAKLLDKAELARFTYQVGRGGPSVRKIILSSTEWKVPWFYGVESSFVLRSVERHAHAV